MPASSSRSLHPAGIQAARISHLWWLMFWIVHAVWVAVAMAALLVAIAAAAADSATGHRRAAAAGRSSRSPEASAVVDPVRAAVRERRHRPRARLRCAPPDALRIEVTGYQWWWDVEYDNPIRRCASRPPTRSTFRSAGRSGSTCCPTDVIHSFWIPNLHGKIDLVPGRHNELWLQADTPGVYRGQCAEYCGLQHAHMALVGGRRTAGRLRALARRRNARPRRRRRPPSSSAAQDVVERGPCAMCHTIARHDARRTHRARPHPRRVAQHASAPARCRTRAAPRRLDRRSAAHQAGQPHAADRAERRRAAGGPRLPGDA